MKKSRRTQRGNVKVISHASSKQGVPPSRGLNTYGIKGAISHASTVIVLQRSRVEKSERYRASILSTSSLASLHVSRFFFAQSMWHLAYAICKISVSDLARKLNNGASLTMYRLRSSSFSSWKRFRSFSTPALASLTSCSDTSSACSNYASVK